MTFNNIFGGDTINPANLSLIDYATAVDLTLVWPSNAQFGSNLVADKTRVNATVASLSVNMPPANQVSVGQDVLFVNIGANTFTVKDNAGTTIVSVASGQSWFVYVTDNSTAAGTWASFQMGSGTSSASAGSLAGLGVKAVSTTLNQDHPIYTKAATYTVLANDRASLLISTGGAITFAFTAAATLTTGWFTLIRNQGSGTLTLNPDGAELIDGSATKALAIGDACIVYCDGSAFYTVGFGQSVTSTITAISINAAGTGTVTMSAVQIAAQIQTFTGLLTGARVYEYGTAPGYWFVYNNTTGAFTLTCRVNGADAGAAITQGTYAIIRSDGTNMTVAMSTSAGTVTNVATGTGLTGGPITTTGTVSLANTAVAAGSYTYLAATIDAQGRITAASSGTAPVASVTSVGATAPIASSGGFTPTISINDSGVTAASYTNASLTVNAKGLITAASSGTAPVTSVSGTSPIASSGGATPAISLNDTAVTPGTYTQATFTVDAKGRLTAASSAAYSIIAMCAFNGTGTPAFIGSDINFASITDNATGNYTLNFSVAEADANYIVSASVGPTGNTAVFINVAGQTVNGIQIITSGINSGSSSIFGADPTYISVVVYRVT